jgi:hypothetical protein
MTMMMMAMMHARLHRFSLPHSPSRPPPSMIEDLRNLFALLNDEEFESEVQLERPIES